MSATIKVKSSWVYALLTVLVVSYLVVMGFVTSAMSSSRLCAGIMITVHDTARYKFVTPEGLALELGNLPAVARKTPLSHINIDSLERALDAFDKIESANINVLSDGKIHIDVNPMHPVVRIFDSNGNSYYLNRKGKRIKADARYHLDVPVVYGDFDRRMPATSIIPLVDFINGDSLLTSLISMIKVDSPTDIILVPVIRGHVINIGDTLNYDDKFRRLTAMYTKVFSVRGWEFYDTISVKWQGQIVASRRNKSLDKPEIIVETRNEEAVDVTTMMSGTDIAPGQALAGRPVHNEKLIPARRAEKAKPTDKSKKN